MSTSTREDKLDLMSLNLKLLSVAGVIPSTSITGSAWKRALYKLFSVNALLCYLLIITAQFLAMYRFWGDLDVVTDNAFTMVGIFMCYVMWAYVTRRAAGILQLAQLLESCIASSVWNKEKWQHAKEMISVADRKARFLTWSMFLLVHGMLATWIIVPLALCLMHSESEEDADDKKPSPYFCFIIWLPFEATRSPVYELVYMVQATSFLMASLFYTSINTTIITFIIHIAAQLRILAWSLKSMDTHFPAEPAHGDPTVAIGSKYTKASAQVDTYFVECIEHHKSVIRFVSEVNDLLSPLILFFFLCSQLIMCVVTFQVVLSLGEDKSPVKFVLGLLAATCGPLMFCWYGDHVIQASMEVQEAAYASLWYHRSSYFKRTLCFVIMRSLKPIRLTGIFYDLSLRTYMQMLNSVYTYFAVLNQLYNK